MTNKTYNVTYQFKGEKHTSTVVIPNDTSLFSDISRSIAEVIYFEKYPNNKNDTHFLETPITDSNRGEKRNLVEPLAVKLKNVDITYVQYTDGENTIFI